MHCRGSLAGASCVPVPSPPGRAEFVSRHRVTRSAGLRGSRSTGSICTLNYKGTICFASHERSQGEQAPA